MYAEMADERDKSKLREAIDANLRRVYNEALNEEVPDHLKRLLEQLRNQERKP